jgi:hypothetical protein
MNTDNQHHAEQGDGNDNDSDNVEYSAAKHIGAENSAAPASADNAFHCGYIAIVGRPNVG